MLHQSVFLLCGSLGLSLGHDGRRLGLSPGLDGWRSHHHRRKVGLQLGSLSFGFNLL